MKEKKKYFQFWNGIDVNVSFHLQLSKGRNEQSGQIDNKQAKGPLNKTVEN